MKPKKSRKLLWGILGITFAIFLSLGAVGGIKYMDYQKEEREQVAREHKLYKRGFRLLEEQIAIYTKEHYEGVSKIEFSPIFIQGEDGYSMFRIAMVPVIYDNYGNRAILGGKTKKFDHKSYSMSGELDMNFDGGDNSEIIILKKMDTGEEVDVSNDAHLPKKAELDSFLSFDENVEDLVHTGKLKGVKKSDNGSPDAEVTYNTEIRKGSYKQWH